MRELTDNEATILMVDSNLQREKILPSERAFAYKMKLEAMERQGRRSDLELVETSSTSSKTRDRIAEQEGISGRQVSNYIRLTKLIPEILQMVDDKKIAFRPAVELSYLGPEEQQSLLVCMQAQECTPSHAQAIRMKKFSEEGKLNPEVVEAIMSEQKPNQKEQLRIPFDKLTRYFPSGTSEKEIAQTIIKALDLYRSREKCKTEFLSRAAWHKQHTRSDSGPQQRPERDA